MTKPISLLGARMRRLSDEFARITRQGAAIDAGLVALERVDGRERSDAVEQLRAALNGVHDATAHLSEALAAIADEEDAP